MVDIMISRHALIGSPSEGVEVAPIARPHNIGDLLSMIIPGACHRPRRRRRIHGEWGRWDGESFVDIDVRLRRVVHHQQRHMIEKVRLPQLRGDAQIIDAVARHELVAANLYPVLRHQHAGRILGVDAQSQR